MTDHSTLVQDLRRLGDEARIPPVSAGLATSVLNRVANPTQTPAPSLRQRVARELQPVRRRVIVAVLALLAALIATPPVRAAVADWFGFGGVVVRQGPSFGDEAPTPAPVDDAMTVDDAVGLVAFEVRVPAALGDPDAVDVSRDRRIVSMSWSTPDGPVRLDQFDGRLDFTIAKTSPGVRYAAVAGVDALWFDRPHEVVLLDEKGRPRTESARLAGNTLIWPAGDLTLRLEGNLSLSKAVEIATSATPYDAH